MKLWSYLTGRKRKSSLPLHVALTLALTLCALGTAAQAQSADIKSAVSRPDEDAYRTIYLTNISQQNDANELQIDLRNMLPKAKVYYVASQSAISIRATPEDFLLAQKIVADLDRPKKVYRLTYTITETDSGKRIEARRFSVLVAAGGKTMLKQGSRVPIVTGKTDSESSAPSSQVQYVDVGLNIEANLDGYGDNLKLRSKVEQSSLAEEKSGISAQDPVIRQTVLEGVSALGQSKPIVLGSLDIPFTSHHQEIEVVSELLH